MGDVFNSYSHFGPPKILKNIILQIFENDFMIINNNVVIINDTL